MPSFNKCKACQKTAYIKNLDLCMPCLMLSIDKGGASLINLREGELPLEAVLACTTSEHRTARYALAASSKADTKILDYLAIFDPDESVRAIAVKRCGLKALMFIGSSDDSVDVLMAAEQRLLQEQRENWYNSTKKRRIEKEEKLKKISEDEEVYM